MVILLCCAAYLRGSGGAVAQEIPDTPPPAVSGRTAEQLQAIAEDLWTQLKATRGRLARAEADLAKAKGVAENALVLSRACLDREAELLASKDRLIAFYRDEAEAAKPGILRKFACGPGGGAAGWGENWAGGVVFGCIWNLLPDDR